MIHKILPFIAIFAFMPIFTADAAVSRCSKTNLTRCLDSACAINIGMNPSARCQYCGTSAAGTPPVNKKISNVTVGQSTKYAFTDKELAAASTDPGNRYMWATTECLKKLPDCTTDDVSDIYDSLIEQSCKSAGVGINMTSATKKANTKPTKTECTKTFTACMNKKCATDYSKCPDDSDFTRIVAECATESTGCDEYLSNFKTEFSTAHKTAIEKRETQLQQIAKNYQDKRSDTLESARQTCQRDQAFNKCVESVCARNMPNKCEIQKKDDTSKTEKAMAASLCQFYKTACTALK